MPEFRGAFTSLHLKSDSHPRAVCKATLLLTQRQHPQRQRPRCLFYPSFVDIKLCVCVK